MAINDSWEEWEATPEIRWKSNIFGPSVVLGACMSHALQQKWRIPSTAIGGFSYEWRDVPFVETEEEAK